MCVIVVIGIKGMRYHNLVCKTDQWDCFTHRYSDSLYLLKAKLKCHYRAGTWNQELLQSPLRSTAYWIVPHCLFSVVSYWTLNHRGGIIHSELDTITWIINQCPTDWHSGQSDGDIFSIEVSFYQNDSPMYHVDIKLARSIIIQFPFSLIICLV